MNAERPAERWLLLVHQLPAKPAYLRVKVWRRLQGIGAVPVKNAVYALPAGEQAQEDFEWLQREIVAGGGEALVCEARFIEGLSDREARAKFDAARDTDYHALAEEARALAASLGKKPPADKRLEARAQIKRLRSRFMQTVAIDFFGASGRETVDGLLASLEARLEDKATPPAAPLGALKRRVWVTRAGVQIDRIASAWLIKRFIDKDARFKFVPAKGYKKREGELRFDMFEAEFTHVGDRCTFEVLTARAAPADPALAAIAEIVHDIDLKDGKYGRDEAPGIARLIAGLTLATDDDEQRLARGGEVLDGLYESFRKKRG